MITTSDGEIYEDETAHALGVQMAMTDPLDRNNPRPGRVQGEGGGGGMDPVHFRSPEDAKFRLDQLLRDKASTKKNGYPVDGQEYAPYNNQIRQLRDFLKGQPKSENDEKPVTLAMNLENVQSSDKVEHRGGVLDMRQNLQNSMPRTNDVGEGVILKDNPLNTFIGKAMSGIHDRHQERINQSLMKAKREMDWVKGKWNIPGDDNNIPFDNEYDIDYAQPPPKAPGS